MLTGIRNNYKHETSLSSGDNDAETRSSGQNKEKIRRKAKLRSGKYAKQAIRAWCHVKLLYS
jgi:hypothetical protein